MNIRLVFLNAVLVLVLATLVFQFRRGLLDYEATHDIESIQAEAEIDISVCRHRRDLNAVRKEATGIWFQR